LIGVRPAVGAAPVAVPAVGAGCRADGVGGGGLAEAGAAADAAGALNPPLCRGGGADTLAAGALEFATGAAGRGATSGRDGAAPPAPGIIGRGGNNIGRPVAG